MPVPTEVLGKCAETIAKMAELSGSALERVGATSERVAASANAQRLLSNEALESLAPKSSTFCPFPWMREPDVTSVPTRVVAERTSALTEADNTVSIDVLSPEQLYRRIETEVENKDLFPPSLNERGRLHYLRSPDWSRQTHVTLSVGKRITGIGGLMTNPHDTSQFWVQHISVEEAYRERGFAHRILESIYDYALRRGQTVVPSGFTKDGQGLKKAFRRLNELYPAADSKVPFRDF